MTMNEDSPDRWGFEHCLSPHLSWHPPSCLLHEERRVGGVTHGMIPGVRVVLSTGLCSTQIVRADSTLTHLTIQVTQL